MSNKEYGLLTWVEIDEKALVHNIQSLRKRVGRSVILAPCVKADAYGHGLVKTARIILKAGADWLCVNSLFEAELLRSANIRSPLYIMGYVLKQDLGKVVKLNARLVVYNRETVEALAIAAKKAQKKAKIHIKVETGNNRQGVLMEELVAFLKFVASFSEIEIEGLATHFANIEDTADDRYARRQLELFKQARADAAEAGFSIPLAHCANSAATLLFPETHLTMVRPGIASYGLWPSEEVKKNLEGRGENFRLQPVLSWKTRIAQIKFIPKGAFIGYGCTCQTKRETRLAVLPVGYYDGYDRGLSNKSAVLVHGKRAPLLGRVCMNIIMADVTDISEARVEDVATLLGRDGQSEISAEEMAEWAGTINYEVTTRINERIPRITTN